MLCANCEENEEGKAKTCPLNGRTCKCCPTCRQECGDDAEISKELKKLAKEPD